MKSILCLTLCGKFNDYGCGCGWCHDCGWAKEEHTKSPAPPVDAARPELPPLDEDAEEWIRAAKQVKGARHAGLTNVEADRSLYTSLASLWIRERQLLATLRENEGLRERNNKLISGLSDLTLSSAKAESRLTLERDALRAELDAIIPMLESVDLIDRYPPELVKKLAALKGK